MSRSSKIVLFSSIGILFVASCNRNNIIQPVPYDIAANFGKVLGDASVAGVTVELKGVGNSNTYNGKTSSNGVVNFSAVSPGIYNITASIQLTKAQYEESFGLTTTQEMVNFSGSLENVRIDSKRKDHTIILRTSSIGNLLFKQIYYAGSDIKQGAGFRDVFFEVYNNTDEVIYADGLYFAQATGRNVTTKEPYTLDTGQYDWSKSIGQTKGEQSNTHYVYADYTYQVPGSGEEHPIDPGESIVIAATAIDHRNPLGSELVDQRGNPVSVPNPDLTIDLGHANFEVFLASYLESVGKKSLSYDIDNPNVYNMLITKSTNNRDLILDPLGRDSFVIFRGNVDDYDEVPDPSKTKITENTKLLLQIPNSDIIDAVETGNIDPAKRGPRRMDPSLDVGVTAVERYSSQAIIRKVKITTQDGRKILQDTNNSENDFEVIEPPVPGGWKE